MRLFLMIGVGVLFVVGGFVVIAGGVKSVLEASASSSWPQTTGLIRESRVESSFSGGPHGGTHYKPIIRYEYSVAGKSYTGMEIYPGMAWSAASSWRAVIRFPAGMICPVFYSPEHPEQALLETGLHRTAFQNLVCGCLVLSMGALAGIMAYLTPKYGLKGAGGSYTFPPGSPLSKVLMGGVLLVFSEFLLLWALHD